VVEKGERGAFISATRRRGRRVLPGNSCRFLTSANGKGGRKKRKKVREKGGERAARFPLKEGDPGGREERGLSGPHSHLVIRRGRGKGRRVASLLLPLEEKGKKKGEERGLPYLFLPRGERGRGNIPFYLFTGKRGEEEASVFL